MVFQYLESTLHTLVVATSDKRSGCQEQPLLKMVCIKLVTRLLFKFSEVIELITIKKISRSGGFPTL